MHRAPVAVIALALGVLFQGPSGAQTIGTAFTYQGRLTGGGSPVSGAHDFEFRLFDSAAGTAQVGPTVTVDDLAVASGLFTVTLDFGGSAFTGDRRWLEIGVRPGASSDGYVVLAPRQELTASPHALFSRGAPWTGLTGVCPSGSRTESTTMRCACSRATWPAPCSASRTDVTVGFSRALASDVGLRDRAADSTSYRFDGIRAAALAA